MRRIFTLLLLATMLGATLRAEHPRPEGRQSVGLVLSGGGAKGIAHIGMIKALEENGIPIDYITGTSMGAIVGGLYAAGYTPEEMLDLIASKDFSYWSTGRINPSDIYYYLTRHDTPAFLTVNLGKDSSQITSVLPVSLINPIPMNYAFIELFAPYTMQCGADFNRLFVPFRCVTSDVWAKHKVVLRSGPLGDAVRMSMSFPMIFEPISIDGVPMYDGGIYDNYPVDVMMEDFNPDAVIGVNVGSGKSKPDTRNMMAQLEEMIMQPNDYPFPEDRGISIRINLDEFGLLAFGKYKEIYDIGYRRGLEVMDSIKMKVSARVDTASVTARRNRFKAATPEVSIEDVRISGGNETQDRFLRSFFYHRGEREPLTLQQGRDAYYRAVTACNLQNFVPTPVYNVADSSMSLDFKAVIKDPYTVGIGGYISSSTNSMLFFNAGYNSLSFKSIHTDLNAWLGQSYLAAEGDFTVMADSHRPSAFTVRAVVSRQKYHETEKLFYQIHEPDFIRQSEFYVRAFYSTAPSLRSEFDVGVGYGHLTDKYHTDLREQDTEPGRDRCIFDLGQFKVKWGRNTLDNPFSPSAGCKVTVAAQALWGRYSYTPGSDSPNEPAKQTVKWIQADVQAERYFPLGRRFSIGASGRLLVSTRKLLPTYMASIVAAEAFHPTASSYNNFNTRLRANQFAAACIMPVWNISGQFQLRGIGCAFMPLRSIHSSGQSLKPVYGKWFSDPVAFAELQALYRLPFGTVSAYGNYTSSPGAQWNFGISIGAFILAPKFI